MSRRSTLGVGATIVAVGVAGCGGSAGSAAKPVDPNKAEVSPAGDIPDNQAFVAFSPPGGGYTVKVPEGWSRRTSGRSTTFTDKLNSITMEAVPAHAPLTTGDATRTELKKLAKTVDGFKPGTVSSVVRRAGRGVRITYLAAGRPDPVTGKARPEAVERYVFFHKGRDVVLTLRGAKGADNVDPWKIVTGSLRYTR